jgi:Fur family ferric uptake transcriptional regulator
LTDSRKSAKLARAEHRGEVSHQAVYDVLGALTAAGLVRRIETTDRSRRDARV